MLEENMFNKQGNDLQKSSGDDGVCEKAVADEILWSESALVVTYKLSVCLCQASPPGGSKWSEAGGPGAAVPRSQCSEGG